MNRKTIAIVSLTVAALVLGLTLPATADEAVDKAFETLKSYDWGQDRTQLEAIDKAVAASHDDQAAQKALEGKLVAVLGADVSDASKDLVCRQLSLIGSPQSVPALAGLLADQKLSHMARYALERMPCAEAVKAMRDAVSGAKGMLKVGVINSLGVRRDAASTEALVVLLADSDLEIAAAAAAALGEIGSPDAAKALAAFQEKAPAKLLLPVADARLACAEQLLAAGKKADATLIYGALRKLEVKHVQVAAMRGMLAAARKQ